MFRTAAAAVLALAVCAPPALAQDPPAEPPQSFALQCKFCHDDDTLGPPLAGVHGRKVGAAAFEYSDAFKAKKDVTWDDVSLDAFLKNPNEFAPGTKMGLAVPDDKARAEIIAYLKALK